MNGAETGEGVHARCQACGEERDQEGPRGGKKPDEGEETVNVGDN